jgi:crotonobetainyl-CoA:carnitine CoA-transferase CaiB-like acyl-CoA transferase
MSLPLHGIRVLELGDFLPSAYACMQMGDFGADVIRVQPPAGAARGRRAEQAARVPEARRSPFDAERRFDASGRNRRSIVMDLKHPDAQDAARRLADTCDVLVEGYRPGVMERLGLDHATLAARNPRLVYCSVSLFGQTGPYRDHPGHDPLALGVSGLLHLNSDAPADVPRLIGSPVGDIGAGLHALSGVLLALRERDRSGLGQRVDISMTEAGLAFSMLASIQVLQGTTVPRLNKPNAVSGIFETADRRFIVTTNLEPHHWANFCRSIGREDLVPLRHDRSRRDELHRTVTEVLRTRTRDEWLAIFHGDLESQAGPVNRIEEVFDDPQVVARGLVVDVLDEAGRPGRQLGPTIRLGRTPGRVAGVAPPAGRDTRALLTEAGLSAERIARLLADGVVADAGG